MNEHWPINIINWSMINWSSMLLNLLCIHTADNCNHTSVCIRTLTCTYSYMHISPVSFQKEFELQQTALFALAPDRLGWRWTAMRERALREREPCGRRGAASLARAVGGRAPSWPPRDIRTDQWLRARIRQLSSVAPDVLRACQVLCGKPSLAWGTPRRALFPTAPIMSLKQKRW